MDSRKALRSSWDDYGVAIAKAAAIRADCTRRKVGAVIMNAEHRIVSTGYNGSPPGGPSCLAGECPRGKHYEIKPPDAAWDGKGGWEKKCACGSATWPCARAVAPGSSYDTGDGSCIALHAEQNAILYCRLEDRKGSTLYCTDFPCEGCLRLIRGAGIARVVTPTSSMALTQVSSPYKDNGYSFTWYSFCSAHREIDPQCLRCHAGRWIDEADPKEMADRQLFKDDPAEWIRKHNV